MELKTTHLQMLTHIRRAVPPPRDGLTVVYAKHPTVRYYRFLYDAVGGPWHWQSRRKLSDEQLARLKPTPRAKIIRRALQLTQEEFAARYHIPVGTLRDWEQGRAEPDQPARAYLRAIAGDPQAVQRALEAAPRPRTD